MSQDSPSWRRLAVCCFAGWQPANRNLPAVVCRLPAGETADCHSALRARKRLKPKRYKPYLRQFTLHRGASFGTLSDVRMIVASIALLAGIPAMVAQEQEGKLVNRILKPNMSLVNIAQNQKFDAACNSLAKPARSKSFWTPDNSLAKSFPAQRAFPSRQFVTRHCRAEETAAYLSARSQLIKADTIHVASASEGTRVAPENRRSLPVASFAGDRPFLNQGRSQQALSARDTPLTIDQVRELLNKNK